MYVFIKNNGKIIAAYEKRCIIGVRFENKQCVLFIANGMETKFSMDDNDFSDLMEQLKTNEVC